MVDVNVHPTKLEVRFQESGRLYSQLLGTLRTQVPDHRPDGPLAAGRRERSGRGRSIRASADADAARAGRLGQRAIGRLRQTARRHGRRLAGLAQATLRRPLAACRAAPLELSTLDRRWAAGRPARATTNEATPMSDRVDAPRRRRAGAPPRPLAALQLHNRYLVTESDDGMVVIDQHALHERILYEQLREKVLAGAVESQALLVPEPVDLSPAEAAAALEARDVLAQLGLAIEPFGGDTVLVSSYPAMLANFRPAEVLRDLVDQLLAGGKKPDRRDLLDSLLHMISCKAAIKAGDRLTRRGDRRPARAAAPGPGHAPLPARPPDGAVLQPRGAGQAVQADLKAPRTASKAPIAAIIAKSIRWLRSISGSRPLIWPIRSFHVSGVSSIP